MTAEADFISNPVKFLQGNLLRPIIHGVGTGIKTFKFTRDATMEVKKGQFNWYNRSLKFYKAEEDPNGTVVAYVLGYKDDTAASSILGVNVGDPKFMFTYRMDGCSLGFAQNGGNNPAYVSHHNDKVGGNNPVTIQNQQVDFSDGTNPVLNFTHKSSYMTDSTGSHNAYYKSTTVGVRDSTGVWRFYLQVRKYHGQTGDKNLSLKGVIAINP
jgi:hypothetical protein